MWDLVVDKCGFTSVPRLLEGIMQWLLPIARKNSVNSVLGKLIFAASSYFIWQERNARLFKNIKRTNDQVIGIILETIRLKLITFRFKKTVKVDRLIEDWNLPRDSFHVTNSS